MAASPVVVRGVVRRLEGRKPHVEIADFGVGALFGPCETATGMQLQKGDRVLCVSVSGIREDVVVVAKLDPDSLEDRLAALEARIVALEQP